MIKDYNLSLETIVIRKKALLSLDHWFDKNYSAIEEYDLLIRISFNWKFAYQDIVLAMWRIHEKSLTWTNPELFISEKKNMLLKYQRTISNFELIYKNELKVLKQKLALEEFLFLWKENRKTQARLIMSSYRYHKINYFILFYLSFFPFKVFKLLKRLRGLIDL